jgi:Flp pilus assembly protein, protease CpaA
MQALLAQVLLVLWAGVAAAYDWRFQRLPNWLTLGGLAAGAAYLLLAGAAPLGGDPLRNWMSAGVALLVLLPPYVFRWMGAGDVKFFLAMGLLGGAKVLLPAFLFGSLLTGMWALAVVIASRTAPYWVSWKLTARLLVAPTRLPFGVGMAVGFALSVLDIFHGLG